MKGLGNDGPYWTALGEGRLQLPRCAHCRRWRWPAPFRCADCGAWDMGWEDVAMEGRIFSWTRTAHPFAGTEALGSPYVTLCVELPAAGGIRLFGLLEQGTEPAIGVAVAGAVRVHNVLDHDIPAIVWRAAA